MAQEHILVGTSALSFFKSDETPFKTTRCFLLNIYDISHLCKFPLIPHF